MGGGEERKMKYWIRSPRWSNWIYVNKIKITKDGVWQSLCEITKRGKKTYDGGKTYDLYEESCLERWIPKSEIHPKRKVKEVVRHEEKMNNTYVGSFDMSWSKGR